MRATGPVLSFFKNENDFGLAASALKGVLDRSLDPIHIDTAVKVIRDTVSYANRNHIVELAMRDKKVMMKSDTLVDKRLIKFVYPPPTLWFGTIEKMAPKFWKNGARSITKGYVKLHDTSDAAKVHAEKFGCPETCVALEVDAESMVSIESYTFTTYEEGEYCVKEVPDQRFTGRMDK